MRSFLKALAYELADNASLYVLLLLYIGLGTLWVSSQGHFATQPYSLYLEKRLILYFLIFPVIAFMAFAAFAMFRAPRHPLTYMIEALTTVRLARFAAGLIFMLMLIYFQGTFALVKTALPGTAGFTYDAYLADLDRALHFGIDPWRFLQPLFHSATLRYFIETNYVLVWVFYVFGVVFWISTCLKASQFRKRYLVCYALNWVLLGSFIAAGAMSAGPCYFGYVTGDMARFSELVQYTQTNADLSPIARSQNYLWLLHQNGETAFGTGISAFPSLHVALVALNAFFAREISRKLALAAWVYVAIIQLSSVYTGWHYAIDGYAAIALTGTVYFGLRLLWPHLARFSQRSTAPAPVFIAE